MYWAKSKGGNLEYVYTKCHRPDWMIELILKVGIESKMIANAISDCLEHMKETSQENADFLKLYHRATEAVDQWQKEKCTDQTLDKRFSNIVMEAIECHPDKIDLKYKSEKLNDVMARSSESWGKIQFYPTFAAINDDYHAFVAWLKERIKKDFINIHPVKTLEELAIWLKEKIDSNEYTVLMDLSDLIRKKIPFDVLRKKLFPIKMEPHPYR